MNQTNVKSFDERRTDNISCCRFTWTNQSFEIQPLTSPDGTRAKHKYNFVFSLNANECEEEEMNKSICVNKRINKFKHTQKTHTAKIDFVQSSLNSKDHQCNCLLDIYYFFGFSKETLFIHKVATAIEEKQYNELIIGPTSLLSFIFICVVCWSTCCYSTSFRLYHHRSFCFSIRSSGTRTKIEVQ